jgi:hypothetical protein
MGTSKIYDSSAAFDLKSLNPILQLVSQGLQIGGTSGGEKRFRALQLAGRASPAVRTSRSAFTRAPVSPV